jgi:hypothetical protein
LIIAAFAWPQTLLGRLKRLRAIKIQLVLIVILLALSWGAYAYFHHFTQANCTSPYTLHNGSGQSGTILPSDLGKKCNFNPPTLIESQSTVLYSINWQSIFGRPWTMLLGPGISPLLASVMTLVFLALPSANFYRYKIDRKRIQGIKKEKLFI